MTSVQLAVVGGGSAGLSAAIAAARAGVQVTLYDENATLGGQLRYRILDGEVRLAAHRSALIAEAIEVGVEVHTDAKVWGLFPDRTLGVLRSDRSFHVRAEQIVLATGSTDLAFPFPGGSLPGVMTARALQIVLHCHRVLPGERYAVIGIGAEAQEIVRDISLAGGTVVVMCDPSADDRSLTADGDDGVQAVTNHGRRHDIDIVIVAVGRQPDAELAMMAECVCGFERSLGGIVPVRDERFRTSVEGLLVAGDAAGVCAISTALAEGTVAGLSVATALGKMTEEAFVTTNALLGGSSRRGSSLVPVSIHV